MNGSARAQRVLAFTAIALFGLTLLAFVALLLAPVFGVTDYRTGAWPSVLVFPLFALPTAFVMFAIVLGMVWFRKKN